MPLADLSDAGVLLETIANALPLPPAPGVETWKRVVDELSRRPALLVLDNFEQLLTEDASSKGRQAADTENAALIIRALLARVPSLVCLITSRRRLRLTGEREFPIAPLATPQAPESPALLMHCESVQMFVDRAQAARPDFQLTDRNVAAVAELCERLEGLPLAIELAAARCQVLTPVQMLVQLQRRLDFLVSRQRDVAYRHRTLRAAFDWSYDMLPPALQRLFVRLSVFRGGWTLAAASAIAMAEGGGHTIGEDTPSIEQDASGNEPICLDYLAQLVECSLIQAERSCGEVEGEVRFRMLEMAREFADEKLTAEGRNKLTRIHGAYFLELAETASRELYGAEQRVWLARLETDHDNLRTALSRLQESGDAQACLRLVAALWRFWDIRGHQAEGRARLAEALTQPGAKLANAVRAKALIGAGILAWNQAGCAGDFMTAPPLLRESLEISRACNDLQGVANALITLGIVAVTRLDFTEARTRFQESLDINRKLANPRGIALSLRNIGNLALEETDYPAARAALQQCLALNRENGDRRGAAEALEFLGRVALRERDYGSVRRFLEESPEIYGQLGFSLGTARGLQCLGIAAGEQADLASAVELLERSLELHQKQGNRCGMAQSCLDMGKMILVQGDHGRARSLFERSLALFRELAIHQELPFSRIGMANAGCGLARVARKQAQNSGAAALFFEALAELRDLGPQDAAIDILTGLAELASEQQLHTQAVLLLCYSETVRRAVHLTATPTEQNVLTGLAIRLQEILGIDTFTLVWNEGAATPLCEAIDRVLVEKFSP